MSWILPALLLVASQQAPVAEPDAPPDVPPAATPVPTADDALPPPVETNRRKRFQDAVEASKPAPVDATPTAPVATPLPPAAAPLPMPNQFERMVESGPGHYLFYYAPDYASVVLMGGLTVTSLVFPPPVSPAAAFGPSYDPATRNTSQVYSSQYDRLLGGQFRQDTVPAWLPPVAGNVALLGMGAVSLVRDRTFRKIHHFILGAAQAQLSTALITELSKAAFGRLRPDYRDRMALYYCAPDRGPPPEGVDCSGARAQASQMESNGQSSSGLWLEDREFDNGRRSFPSGHASSSFAIATYMTLFAGGEFVWGENASAATRLPGIAAQVAAMTAAAFVAGSRLTDNRHHVEDVVVGAGLGAGMGALFYFLHFDLAGRPLVRRVSLLPLASGGALGLGVKGLF